MTTHAHFRDRPDLSTAKVTNHALDRLAQHYPRIDWRDVRGLLSRSMQLDGDAVRPVLGRGPRRGDQAPSLYFLPPERQGVLVVEPHRDNGVPVVVTYLRLEAAQRALIDRLWPVEKGAA